MQAPVLPSIKCVVVGSGSVGKTCLLLTYTTKKFPEPFAPTVFDNYSKEITVDGTTIILGLWDTAGGEDYHRIRPLSYPGTDIFVICFSVANPTSAKEIEQIWLPEITNTLEKKFLFLLVGTKIDLRDDKEVQEKLAEKGEKILEYSDGKKLAKKVGACGYLECSSLMQKNLESVFSEAVRAVLSCRNQTQQIVNNQSKICTLS